MKRLSIRNTDNDQVGMPCTAGEDQFKKRVADPHFIIHPAAAIDPLFNDRLEIDAGFRHPFFHFAVPTLRARGSPAMMVWLGHMYKPNRRAASARQNQGRFQRSSAAGA